MAIFAFSTALPCFLLVLPILLTISSETPDQLSMTPQLRNIMDAIVGASDFGSWAGVLNGSDSSITPFSATLLLPADEALSRFTFQSNIDRSTILYHIIPRGLALFDLQHFNVGARLPTLLTDNTILITNNTRANFTLDDVRIIRPNMLSNGLLTLHGIESVLNYTLYGGGTTNSTSATAPAPANLGALSSPAPLLGARRSFSACHSAELIFMVSVIFAVFMFQL